VNQAFLDKVSQLKQPNMPSSYTKEDCIFLMKNVTDMVSELNTEEKEQNISKGIHYSEMLPKEYYPSEDYLTLFNKSLQLSSKVIAQHVADVAELIVKEKGKEVILVSLARAGTPIGVLIKKYIEHAYGIVVPHYSISIIRGKGFDENAVAYIVDKHKSNNLQFIDGWTGKGAINNVLKQAVMDFKEKYDIEIDGELAVLADPSQATSIYGTRKDFLIPSACLNSTVSGLVSRTFHRDDVIGEHDFHGAKYYAEWEDVDLSSQFIQEVTQHFSSIQATEMNKGEVLNTGMKEVLAIKEKFGIKDINKIKPGVGETTRVLLRRVPWKILVDDLNNPNLEHILLLAKDRNVPVEVFTEMNYSCMGLIKE
jgi:Phosphoribosyl transferase (PRTase)/PELOTA RNA binding domain